MQALEDAGRMILRSYRFDEFSCASWCHSTWLLPPDKWSTV